MMRRMVSASASTETTLSHSFSSIALKIASASSESAAPHGGHSRGPRTMAKELRSIIDQGRDPAGEKLEDSKIAPVENLLRYIAEQMKPDAPEEIQENVSRADNNSGRAVSELEDQTAGETKSLTSLSSRLRKITAL